MARCATLIALLVTSALAHDHGLAEEFGTPPQPAVVRPMSSPFGHVSAPVPAPLYPAASPFDPVEIPATAAVPERSPYPPRNTSLAPVSSPTTAAPPLKYFAPNRRDKDSIDVLRQKYADIIQRRAELMTADELANSIDETQQVIDERLAREALGNVEDALRRIAEDFPETSAGSDARRALSALQHSATPSTPTNTAELPATRLRR